MLMTIRSSERFVAQLERDDQFKVTTATNASEALDRFSGMDFDCIISSHDMSDKTRIESHYTPKKDRLDHPGRVI